jgi:hypothetical protein
VQSRRSKETTDVDVQRKKILSSSYISHEDQKSVHKLTHGHRLFHANQPFAHRQVLWVQKSGVFAQIRTLAHAPQHGASSAGGQSTTIKPITFRFTIARSWCDAHTKNLILRLKQ